MHVFLLDLPRLEFAALIPKNDFVTVCLLGEEIDKEVIEGFLSSREVQEVLPPHWEVPRDYCHCSPRLNVDTAVQPYGDRVVFIGDCGTTRLFKDGIGAAYRTAKAAARTAVFHGVAAEDFRRSFWPTCRRIHADNRLGKVVFTLTKQVQRRRFARRALWRMTSWEQKLAGSKRRMSRVLWDTFTGSAPYRSVFARSMHPAFLGRFGLELVGGLRSGGTLRPRERVSLATGVTGLTARRCAAGDVVYRQGEPADGMYLLHDGEVELLRGSDGDERSLVRLAAGAFFGETALLGRGPRASSARMTADGSLFTLERTSLLARIHEDPSMAFRLVEHLARRLGELEAELVATAGGGPQSWEPVRPSAHAGADATAAATVPGQMGRRYEPGQVIYRQGDRGDCMFVIQSGAVELVRRSGAHEHAMARLGPGDYFGERALFQQEIRPDTARALEEGYVFTLERNGLLRRIHEDPSMALQLIVNLVQRLAGLEDALDLGGSRSPAPAQA
jgi:CRP-like cAMP-binding protein